MSNDSIRFHLRACTSGVHARLDASMGAFESREAYRRYLPGMLAFREAAEDAVSRMDRPEWFGSWRPQELSCALRADMADLGLDAPAEPYRDDDLGGTRSNVSALLGTLYVLEGSALGARLLYGRALKLGLDGSFGARHLALQTQDRNGWQNFVNILESAGERVDREEAGRASLLAFELAERRLANRPVKNLAKEA